MTTTLSDITHSGTAIAKHIDNSPVVPVAEEQLEWLCRRVDECIALLTNAGYSPRLTSGYRNPAVSVAVGGHVHDEHTSGRAFDLGCGLGDAGSHLMAARVIFDDRRALGGNVHQVLAEPGHVHVGFYPIGVAGKAELRIKDGVHYTLLERGDA